MKIPALLAICFAGISGPAAAVDVEDQRRGPRRIRAPEIEHLPLVGSVGDIGERRRALRRLGLRCLGWFTGAQWRG